MASPTPTTRGTPGGIPLFDGFSTKITLAADTDVSFWEKTVTPPALEGGDAIDITTMHNTLWRTKNPRTLIDMGEISITASYDPAMYTQAQSLVNVNTTITVAFPDGTTIAIWGYMRNFTPNDVAEGAQPEASIVLVPTNYDHTAGVHAEAGPTVTSVTGT